MNLKEEHKKIIRHALGACTVTATTKRDYYCTTVGDPIAEGMVSMGLMRRGGIINGGRDQYYLATAEGAAAVGLTLPE
jgi:hypothetical protein|tara:strand:- start:510 stop:743 length:234 start_codon:yes stop_codon:yes gene_type:complete